MTLRLARISTLVAALLLSCLPSVTGVGGAANAVPVGCSWPVYLGADGLNLLAPDYQAHYWLLHYEALPGTSLRIEGRYPDARYFSHTIQDEETITTQALIDEKIRPDVVGTNPFRTPGAQPGAKYTVHLRYDAVPAKGPKANTLYGGQMYSGETNPGGTLIYRVYVPTDQKDPMGGVGLPTVVQETPLGDVPLTYDDCPGVGGGIDGPANDATQEADRPGDLPGVVPPSAAYTKVPNFVRLFAGFFTDPFTQSLPPEVGSAFPTPDGVPLANAPFPYLASNITRQFGKVVVIRFKAPTFPDTVHGDSVTKATQARYWSLCSYAATEEAALRGNACATDFQVATARGRWVTFVVSDPAHRPAQVIKPRRGVHWLPWGPWDKSYLLLRFGIPSPDWKNSPLAVDPDAPNQVTAAATAMGDYYPVARYCDAQTIKRRGLNACFRN